MYLRTEEYMPYAPDEIGQRVRVNHNSSDCAGDSSSMVVERKRDGVYAKCFRCGCFGSNREGRVRGFFDAKKAESDVDVKHGAITMPYDSQGDTREWPSKARVWIRRARVTDDEVKRYGISYSARLGRIVLPVYDDGNMVGYQARKIHESDVGPKYYTRTSEPERMVFTVDNSNHPDTIVLCEDVLSAIRVGRFVSAGAILGTSTSNYSLSLLTQDKKHAIIYLDYDNRVVINTSIKLKNKLELLLSKVDLIRTTKDPKTLSDTELESVLNKYIIDW